MSKMRPWVRWSARGLCACAAAVAMLALTPGSANAAPGGANLSAPVLPQTIVGLRQGSRGDEVRAVQQALLDAGIKVHGGADGVYGPATRTAVTAYQTSQGLSASGEVDSATASALGLGGSAPAAVASTASGLAIGAKGAEVKALQQALMGAGVFVPGGADGQFGRATQTALSSFQRWNGLEDTGTLTPASKKLLGLNGSTPQATPQPTPTVSANPYIGLAVGARGDLVKALQQAVLDSGIAVRGGADGAFGPATKSALQSYQRANGLDASGTADNATVAKLGLGTAPTPPAPAAAPEVSSNGHVGLTVGARGDKVKDLQRALMQTGLTLRGGADGVFGNATKSTLLLFQGANGTPKTGVVGEKDATLLGLGTTAGPQGIASQPGYAGFGERSDRVRELQQSLIDAGIAVPGGADGHFGSGTAGAVMSFQRREGLTVTGKIDEATAAKLSVAKAKPPAPPSTEGVELDVFPVEAVCGYVDTWHAPRGSGRLHVGTDIISAGGKLLYAVVDGEISKIYYDYPGALAGNGLRVAEDNGTYFTYLHLSSFAPGIEVGTKVKAGDVIGYVGSTGSSATPHLHFEIHPNGGEPVNPYPFLKAIDAC